MASAWDVDDGRQRDWKGEEEKRRTGRELTRFSSSSRLRKVLKDVGLKDPQRIVRRHRLQVRQLLRREVTEDGRVENQTLVVKDDRRVVEQLGEEPFCRATFGDDGRRFDVVLRDGTNDNGDGPAEGGIGSDGGNRRSG